MLLESRKLLILSLPMNARWSRTQCVCVNRKLRNGAANSTTTLLLHSTALQDKKKLVFSLIEEGYGIIHHLSRLQFFSFKLAFGFKLAFLGCENPDLCIFLIMFWPREQILVQSQ